MLSKTVIALLDALAEAHDLKRAQITEKLVRMKAYASVILPMIERRSAITHSESPRATLRHPEFQSSHPVFQEVSQEEIKREF